MINQLAEAIHARIKTATTLPVFDDVPAETPLPYVVHYLTASRSNDAHNQLIEDIEYQVSVYSNYSGHKEVQEQADKIKKSLHRWKPTLANYDFGYLVHEETFFYDDPSDGTKNVALTFKTSLYHK